MAEDKTGEATKAMAKVEAPVEAKETAYVILVDPEEGVDVPEVTPSGEPLWVEIGTITAKTRPDAWEAAKAKWPARLVPPAPASALEAKAQRPIRAKVVPSRNFVTIESSVEYVPPRAVATGI